MIMMFLVTIFIFLIIVVFLLMLVHFLLRPSRKLVVTKRKRSILFGVMLLELLIFVLPKFESELVLLFGTVFNLMVSEVLIKLFFFLWMIDQPHCSCSSVGNFHYLI
jgi:hypothetical protein